jgi:hypothetical protein
MLGGAQGGSGGVERDVWSGGLGSMAWGTGTMVLSLSMAERGRRKRTMESRKVELS